MDWAPAGQRRWGFVVSTTGWQSRVRRPTIEHLLKTVHDFGEG